jgi:UDP-N-acetylmuramoylalanine--D-glutamate ligase
MPLGEEIAKRLNVKAVILMGETKGKIERAIEAAVGREDARIPLRRRDIPLELISAETYQEAFMVARMMAQPGDTVLLSPACASFDMFKNYQERGEIFRNFVDLNS